jgi:hypothetical protein
LDEAVFQNSMEELDADADREAPHYFLNSPPELFPTSSSTFRIPQPSKALRDGYREPYLQRPLPELPTAAPPGLSRRSSVASARSATPSITPSLLQYLDQDSINPEEIEVGIAQLIHLPPSESTLSLLSDEDPQPMPPIEYSFSDYENSPQSTNDSFSVSNNNNKTLSPTRYLPTTGSGLEHGLTLFTSPKHPGSGSRRSLPSAFYSEQDLALLENITLTESEWMSRSPSPTRTRAANKAARRNSSSSPGKMGGGSFFKGLRMRKLSGSPRRLKEMVLGREVSKGVHGGEVGQEGGNWI